MPKGPYTKNGIAGVSGRNLDSVRDALGVSGLYPLRMSNGGNPLFRQRYDALYDALGPLYSSNQGLDLEKINKARETLSKLPGMESTDYDVLRREDKEQAALNFYLKLAQRGFEAAGATPRVGETGLSTVSRELAAPLASDVSEIASDFYKRKQAYKQLDKEEQRALSQAALTYRQSERAKEAAEKDKRRSMAWTMAEENIKSVGLEDALEELTAAGKWVPFVGFTGITKWGEAPSYFKLVDGKRVNVENLRVSPTAASASSLKGITDAGLKPVSFSWPIREVVDGEVVVTGVKTAFGEVYSQVNKNTGRVETDTSRIFSPGSYGTEIITGPDGKPIVFGVDVKAADPNWLDDSQTTLYVKPGLSEEELKTLQNITNIPSLKRGDTVIRQRQKRKENEASKKDLLYGGVSGKYLGELLDEDSRSRAETFFTDQKPSAGDLASSAVGTTPETFILTKRGDVDDKTTITAMLTKQPDESFVYQTVATGNIPSEIMDKEWFDKNKFEYESWIKQPDETVLQANRAPANEAYKKAAQNLTDFSEAVRQKVVSGKLTAGEIQGWMQAEDKATFLRDLVINRATKEQKRLNKVNKDKAPARDATNFFGARYTQDENVLSLTTPLDDQGNGVYINATSIDPYNRDPNQNIPIADWSTSKLTPAIVEKMRRNASAIGENFFAVTGSQMGFEEEQILAHSQLWKHLPNIAEKFGEETFNPEMFRKKFNEAKTDYNKAKEKYVPASEIKIGTSNLAFKINNSLDAIDDIQTMLNYRDVAGAWFADGKWIAEMRGGALGELWETYIDPEGKETAIPSERWLAMLNPQNNADRELREKTLAYFQENADGKRADRKMSMDEFERAATFLGAMNRSMSRVFELIDESRPSDRDVEIMLNGLFVQGDLSETRNLNLMLNLGKKYTDLVTNSMKTNRRAIYDPDTLFRLGQVGKAFRREALPGRMSGPQDKGLPAVKSSYRKWGNALEDVSRRASERVLPGHQGLSMSPITGTINSDVYRNIQSAIQLAARAMFPNLSPEEAYKKFVDEKYYAKSFSAVLQPVEQKRVLEGVTQTGNNTYRLDN